MDQSAGLRQLYEGNSIMSIFGKYLLSVAAAAMLVNVCLELSGNGKTKKTVQFTGGLILVLCILTPVLKMEADQLARSIAKIKVDAVEAHSDFEMKNNEFISKLIKEQTVAYILDKADEWNLSLEIEVTMSEEEGYPYPVGVCISGHVPDAERRRLSEIIASDLGIPKERQVWK